MKSLKVEDADVGWEVERGVKAQMLEFRTVNSSCYHPRHHNQLCLVGRERNRESGTYGIPHIDLCRLRGANETRERMNGCH